MNSIVITIVLFGGLIALAAGTRKLVTWYDRRTAPQPLLGVVHPERGPRA